MDEHFSDLGGANSFVAAVLEGPRWLDHEILPKTMRYRGARLFRQWREKQFPEEFHGTEKEISGIPLYLPYLCLLCLAWTEGEEGILAPNAFYGRLTTLYPEHDLKNHLNEWGPLWEGLQRWTEQKEGAHGLFVVERLGYQEYVGIPKSQVIFTPSRMESLPDLFAELSLQAGSTLSPPKIKAIFTANRAIASRHLGAVITEQICDGTEIGHAAVALILEYLLDWDGTLPGGESTSIGPGGAAGPKPLRVFLEVQEPSGWKVQLGVEAGPDSSAVAFEGSDWRFRPVSSLVAVLSSRSGQFMDGGPIVSGLDSNKVFDADYSSDGEQTCRVRFNLRHREVRYFDRWHDSRLVECFQLPSSGGVYVLFTASGYGDWLRWKAIDKARLDEADYTATGLPEGWRLLRFENLELIPEKWIESFPGNDGAAARKVPILWLSSGTRILSSVSRKLYAQYDPPLVHIKASSDTDLIVTGGSAEEISPGSGNNVYERPGDIVRTFRLQVEPEEDVVVLKVIAKGDTIAQTSFGVWTERSQLGDKPSASVALDRFGNLAPAPGVKGLECPSNEQILGIERPWEPERMDLEEALASPSFNLLDSIGHARLRLTFPDYRRKALEIAGVEYWSLYQESRWLTQLAAIDILSDSKGRWSHVYPIERQLAFLPWKMGDKLEAILVGCGSKSQLRGMMEIAEALGVEITATPSGCSLVPPRILFRHRETAAFEMLAADAKVKLVNGCPAYALARWSASLDDWLGGPINWFSLEPPRHDSEYSPFLYRIIPRADFPAPCRLMTVPDPYAEGHRWHVLVRTNAINEPDTGRKKHAFISDPSWAMWKTQVAVAEGPETLVPYVTSTQSIIVPTILGFPTLLGRALCCSSGLPPRKVPNSIVYTRRSFGILPEDAEPYTGECWEFRGVPRSIAGEVARKLSAEIRDIGAG